MTTNQTGETTHQKIQRLAAQFAQQFVRKDSKYFDVDHLGTALAAPDVEQMILNQLAERFPEVELSNALLKGLYQQLMTTQTSDRSRSFQVWNGTSICLPGNPERLVCERGAVTTNVWVQPTYRQLKINAAEMGPLGAFFEQLFSTETERELFLNWLAYCIQNESEKPSWAPFFYSRRKGTGKSTLCRVMAEVFGVPNTAVQNNVDKLVQQFNATLLRSKLVICEETHLQQGSSKGNAIKTYITDPFILIEQKGKEQVRARNITCFAFTSNFRPVWMEPGERRYAVFDVDHDGGAGGANADRFAAIVGEVHAYLDDPANVARFYNWLLVKKLPDTFNAKSLNIVENATPIMKQLQQTSRQTNLDILEEHLNAQKYLVIPQDDVAKYVREELGAKASQVRHLMDELGWVKSSVKWGGADYARSIWTRPGYAVDGGKVYGPKVDGVPIVECLEKTGLSFAVEIIG
jgi:hypothetical protein